MTIHTNVAAVIADLSDQALRHDTEAMRIRSAIAVLRDIYPNTEAPTPSPEDEGQRASSVENRPTEEKTSDQEPLSSGSGEVHDRSESTSPAIDRAGHIGSWLRSDEKAADAPPAGGAGSASPAPTLRERVKALHDAHPEYTRRQAWEALGITEGSLAGIGHTLGIRWAPAIPAKVERPAPPAPVEDAITPEETVTDLARPRGVTRTKGPQFRLRTGHGEGKYLHMSGTGQTDEKVYAWIGTGAQLMKLCDKFPEARDLVPEEVEREAVRA